MRWSWYFTDMPESRAIWRRIVCLRSISLMVSMAAH
jgi:hypothetical protein